MKKLKCFLKPYLILLFSVLLITSCTSFRVAQREGEILSAPEESPQLATKQFSEGIYVVQAGVFNNITYAQAIKKKLEDKGYNAYISLSGSHKGEIVYKVYIGRFIEKAQAENISEKIKKTDNLDAFVTLKPPRGKFAVQTGAFTNVAQAQALREKLGDEGYNAYIKLSVSDKNEKLYKVLIGEFLDREPAERLSEEIKKKMNLQAFITII